MENPKFVHLADDTHWRSLGWPAVARDSDGHAISTCDNSHEDTFKDWLLECFDEGLTVINLTRPPKVYVAASGSPNLLDCTKPEQDAEGGTM